MKTLQWDTVLLSNHIIVLTRITLTEVVVVLWLSRVADLFDINVGGSGWDPHHCVVT